MLSTAKKSGAFKNCSEQHQRDGQMNRQRVEASHELAEFAALYSVRRSLHPGKQQSQHDEQANTAER